MSGCYQDDGSVCDRSGCEYYGCVRVENGDFAFGGGPTYPDERTEQENPPLLARHRDNRPKIRRT